MHIALTIAGSDPSGGAGLQADLKTFHQHGVYGMGVLSLATVQDTCGVASVEGLPAKFVADQIAALVADTAIDAAKTGALGSAKVVEAVAAELAGARFPLVVDPVFHATRGGPLLDPGAVEVIANRLLPLATLVTPNLEEAERLSGQRIGSGASLADLENAARAIRDLGADHVLIKGGHRDGDPVDLLWSDDTAETFAAPRLDPAHGTGCMLSAAIVARLALGLEVALAVRLAKTFVTEALRSHSVLGRGQFVPNFHAPVPRSP